MELTIIDSNDTPPNDTGNRKGELECEICSVPLVYGGRGRKPRYCAEHKPSPGNSNKGTTRKSGATVDSLVESIHGMYSMVAMGMTMLPATANDGMIVASKASDLAESWRPLLERDAKVRKMWEKAFTVSGYGTLIAAHLMVILPIAQSHNLIPSQKVAL